MRDVRGAISAALVATAYMNPEAGPYKPDP